MLKINKNRLLILFQGKARRLFLLCGRRDSNPHAVRHQILSLARLPIPPRPLNAVQMYVNFITSATGQQKLFKNFSSELKIIAIQSSDQDKHAELPHRKQALEQFQPSLSNPHIKDKTGR